MPRQGPCVRFSERTRTSFAVAMRAAYVHWPDVWNWELIGADSEIEPTAEAHPVAFDRPGIAQGTPGRLLEKPQCLAVFETEAEGSAREDEAA